jgi:hypothetical protein
MSIRKNKITKSLRNLVGDKKAITQISYVEGLEYIDVWREITIYNTESTKHFISLIRKLEDVKASDSDLISRFK